MSFMDDFEHLKIPLKYIKAATNNFKDKPIGSGGFGDVYKGELLLPTGARTVAFKRLNRKFGQGDVEFWKEIIMLSELKHKNLATLLHFCNEDDERILVYKYASRGSLDKYLGDASLTWPQRLDICLGAAKGIAYLHDPKKTQQRVLHRDIKSANILLNGKGTAKVSDFGLSKIGPANQARTYLVSNMVGTPGYCDPAYWETGFLSKECDVYSFGVLLFEVMCGRLCYLLDDNGKVTILVYNWRNCFNENRLHDIIFPDLKEQINHESLATLAAIANRCLDRDLKKRPHMDEIVKELEAAIHQQNSPQRTPYVANTMQVSYNSMEEFQNLKIDLEVIKSATNNFDETKVIGHGGFGNIYRGELSLPDGQRSMVGFKRLDRRYGQGDREFWKEIMVLSKNKHENLVSLLGFCDEGGEKVLTYEYASNGSLDQYLSSTNLTWFQRLRICLGVAQGLMYLHDSTETREKVIHRDIKSANILLDENWRAKISDFGLSKFVPSHEPQVDHVDNIVGTIGYTDPSYMETGIFSDKSDVYSFGVVLFEVMCGKTCFGHHNGQFKMMINKWKKYYEEKKLYEIISADLLKLIDLESLDTFSSVAHKCLTKARDERPSMSEVIKDLKLALKQHQGHSEEMQMISSITKNEPLGDGKTLESDESHLYPPFISSFHNQHTHDGVWAQEEARIQYEEMIKLRDMGANTPTGVPYTEEEILAKVRKGKQQCHIAGMGREVVGLGKRKVFGSQPQGTYYYEPHIDDILAQKDLQLAEAKAEAKAYRRELDELRNALKTDPRMAELLSQHSSRSEMGSGSGTGEWGWEWQRREWRGC